MAIGEVAAAVAVGRDFTGLGAGARSLVGRPRGVYDFSSLIESSRCRFVGEEGRFCGVMGAFARCAGRDLGGVAFLRSSLCHCAIWSTICSALATRSLGWWFGLLVLMADVAVRFEFATVEGGGTGLRDTRYGFDGDFGGGVGAVEGVLRPDGVATAVGTALRVEVTGLRGTRRGGAPFVSSACVRWRGGTSLEVSGSFVIAALVPGCTFFGTIA